MCSFQQQKMALKNYIVEMVSQYELKFNFSNLLPEFLNAQITIKTCIFIVITKVW